MDGGILFKGITFSGHFFEMIIHQLAAGGAAALFADRVNQSQMEKQLTTSPAKPAPLPDCCCQPATNIISPSAKEDAGHWQCHCSKQCGLKSCVIINNPDMFHCMGLFMISSFLSAMNWVFPFFQLGRLCVALARGTQVCVITSVIRPGYGPPASKCTLCPIQRCRQQRRRMLTDYGFDDAARSLCFRGRYFWLRNNLLDLFNLSQTMTCCISVWCQHSYTPCVMSDHKHNKTQYTICDCLMYSFHYSSSVTVAPLHPGPLVYAHSDLEQKQMKEMNEFFSQC